MLNCTFLVRFIFGDLTSPFVLVNNQPNHRNYNFLDFDWFNSYFSTNSLAKLLSDSLLLDTLLLDSLLSASSIGQ